MNNDLARQFAACYHQAGRLRMHRARMYLEAGHFVHAADSWLCAAEFFRWAGKMGLARRAIRLARSLLDQGKISAEQTWLVQAIEVCEAVIL